MKSDQDKPDDMAQPPVLPIRSEAFAEDLEDLLPEPEPVREPSARRVDGAAAKAWLFLLPLAVVLIGSASALVWV